MSTGGLFSGHPERQSEVSAEMDDKELLETRAEGQSGLDSETKARRQFLIKVSTVSATAPAVAVMLAAGLTPSKARALNGGGSGSSGGSA
jgi:hypothetical protein